MTTVDLRVSSPNIARVIASVHAAGSGNAIVQELERGIVAAARPIHAEVQSNVRAMLPASGGLGEWVAQATVRIDSIRGSGTAGVHMSWSRRGSDLNAIDRGRVRHPTFGNRRYWSIQTVPSKTISSVVIRHRPAFERAVAAAVGVALRRVGL